MLEFVDMVTVAPDLRIEELVLGGRSPLAGATVREVAAPYEGAMIMAARSPDGDLMVPPRADAVLHAGDLLIAVGPVEALDALAMKAR